MGDKGPLAPVTDAAPTCQPSMKGGTRSSNLLAGLEALLRDRI
jgi:hypothetical protein